MSSLTRRCPNCSAVAYTLDGERLYVCADVLCERRQFRPSLPVCPRCLGMADLDETSLRCRSGCTALSLPTIDPRAGWELARDGIVERVELGHWQLGAMDTESWYRFGETGQITRKWGAPDDMGDETMSIEGAALMQLHADDVRRIGEMSDALRAFGAAVSKDKDVGKRRQRTASAWLPCLLAHRLAEHADEATSPIATVDVIATQRAGSLATFWADPGCRSEMVFRLGAALCIEIHKAIVRRGGSFADIHDILRQFADVRETPFGGYQHAVAYWCGEHGSTLLGMGSTMSSLGGAMPKFALPGGVQLADARGRGGMSVHETKNGTSASRNAGTLDRALDVASCINAARIGGTWMRNTDPNKAVGVVCSGGRKLTQWERRLVVLCDYGVEITIKADKDKPASKDWRKLTVTEAVDEVRRVAIERTRQVTQPQEVAEWAHARHLTTKDGKVALRAARRAIREALTAWGLIPARVEEDDPKGVEKRAKNSDAERIRNPQPIEPRRGSEAQ